MNRITILLLIFSMSCATVQSRPDPPPNCVNPLWREDLQIWTCYHTAMEGFDRWIRERNQQMGR